MDAPNRLPRTLVEAVSYFARPENCLSYLVSKRWPNGVACPICGSQKVHFDKTRMGWRCVEKHANRRFTLKTGTIFEDSPLGLDKWLPCVWMIANMKNGVSSHEVARSLGVTQKTAWFMLHRVRLAMQDALGGGKLSGEVEVDETYIGGRARNMHASRKRAMGMRGKSTGFRGKVAVMGLLERNTRESSRIRLHILNGTKRPAVQSTVRANVEAGSTLNTDAFPSYVGLVADYMHRVIDHAECYVDGTVHTNGCENFWSLLKRGINGTYVSVEPFHLFRYLDEQSFRFNRRKLTDADRFGLAITGIVGRRLMYQDLIGEGNTPNGN